MVSEQTEIYLDAFLAERLEICVSILEKGSDIRVV